MLVKINLRKNIRRDKKTEYNNKLTDAGRDCEGHLKWWCAIWNPQHDADCGRLENSIEKATNKNISSSLSTTKNITLISCSHAGPNSNKNPPLIEELTDK